MSEIKKKKINETELQYGEKIDKEKPFFFERLSFCSTEKEEKKIPALKLEKYLILKNQSRNQYKGQKVHLKYLKILIEAAISIVLDSFNESNFLEVNYKVRIGQWFGRVERKLPDHEWTPSRHIYLISHVIQIM